MHERHAHDHVTGDDVIGVLHVHNYTFIRGYYTFVIQKCPLWTSSVFRGVLLPPPDCLLVSFPPQALTVRPQS